MLENICMPIIENANIQCVIDLFAGTGSVGYALSPYKRIVSNDLEYYAFVLNEAILNGCVMDADDLSKLFLLIDKKYKIGVDAGGELVEKEIVTEHESVLLDVRKFGAVGDGVTSDTAAIQAAMKERKESIKEVVLTDVCPFTLGTEVVVDLGNGFKESGHYCPIIERNTIIPASRTDRFYTIHDNQSKISIRVLQGESRLADNNLELGVLEIEVPQRKAGDESVDVTYTYDINSILEVEARVISTDKKYRKIIKGQYTEMTDEEIEERFKELAYLKVPPREQEANKLILLRAERLYEEALGIDREVLENEVRKFELALGSQDKRIIEKEREKLKEFLDKWENE